MTGFEIKTAGAPILTLTPEFKIRPQWITINPPVDAREQSTVIKYFKRGYLLQLAYGDGTDPHILLVGDVNDSGGVCNDCAQDGMLYAYCTDLAGLL